MVLWYIFTGHRISASLEVGCQKVNESSATCIIDRYYHVRYYKSEELTTRWTVAR